MTHEEPSRRRRVIPWIVATIGVVALALMLLAVRPASAAHLALDGGVAQVFAFTPASRPHARDAAEPSFDTNGLSGSTDERGVGRVPRTSPTDQAQYRSQTQTVDDAPEPQPEPESEPEPTRTPTPVPTAAPSQPAPATEGPTTQS